MGIGCILKERTMSESEFALIPIGNVQHPKHFGVIYNKLLAFQDTCNFECYSGFLHCTLLIDLALLILYSHQSGYHDINISLHGV